MPKIDGEVGRSLNLTDADKANRRVNFIVVDSLSGGNFYFLPLFVRRTQVDEGNSLTVLSDFDYSAILVTEEVK